MIDDGPCLEGLRVAKVHDRCFAVDFTDSEGKMSGRTSTVPAFYTSICTRDCLQCIVKVWSMSKSSQLLCSKIARLNETSRYQLVEMLHIS